MARRLLAAPLLGLALVVASAGPAVASGVLQKLSLEDALKNASHVLVVEKADPAQREVTKAHPYVDRKTKEKKTLTLKRLLHRFKLVRRLGPGTDEKLKPGAVLEVRDSNSSMGEMVHIAMVTTGTWPIPYVPQLEGQADPSQGKRFLLLLSGYDEEGKHYLGIGGLGLLPVEREARVLRLLRSPKTSK